MKRRAVRRSEMSAPPVNPDDTTVCARSGSAVEGATPTISLREPSPACAKLGTDEGSANEPDADEDAPHPVTRRTAATMALLAKDMRDSVRCVGDGMRIARPVPAGMPAQVFDIG
jgi:hypothetical protein